MEPNSSPLIYQPDDFQMCKKTMQRIRRSAAKMDSVACTAESSIDYHLQPDSLPAIGPVRRSDIVSDAEELIYQARSVEDAASTLIRNIFASEYPSLLQKWIDREPIYAIAATDDMLAVRVPMASYSIYRAALKRTANKANGSGHHTGAIAKQRYPEVVHMMQSIELPVIEGRKMVYICHNYRDPRMLRSAADFDNYDVKDLIDSVTNFYGFDSPYNVMMIHDCTTNTQIPTATFLGICSLRSYAWNKAPNELFAPLFEQMEGVDQRQPGIK